MKVKICGLQNATEVQGTVAAGADLIGFVFAESSRQITIQQAQELASFIPAGIQKVGVFVNPTLAEVEQASREVPLDVIQLHGKESPEFVRQLNLSVIKSLTIVNGKELSTMASYPLGTTFLIDGPGQDFAGGSGQQFDWQSIDPGLVAQYQLFIAGGLKATNVQEAINYFQPSGVDVSSGVETNGKKDLTKIKQFIRAAKGEN